MPVSSRVAFERLCGGLCRAAKKNKGCHISTAQVAGFFLFLAQSRRAGGRLVGGGSSVWWRALCMSDRVSEKPFFFCFGCCSFGLLTGRRRKRSPHPFRTQQARGPFWGDPFLTLFLGQKGSKKGKKRVKKGSRKRPPQKKGCSTK